MADSKQVTEKQQNVALAASLFGDDSAASDIFGKIDEPRSAAPAHADIHQSIGDIFGPSEASSAHDDVNGLFSGTNKQDSSTQAPSYFQDTQSSNSAVAYPDVSSQGDWSADTTANTAHTQIYTDNPGLWQGSGNDTDSQPQSVHAAYNNQQYHPATSEAFSQPVTSYDPNPSNQHYATHSTYSA